MFFFNTPSAFGLLFFKKMLHNERKKINSH